MTSNENENNEEFSRERQTPVPAPSPTTTTPATPTTTSTTQTTTPTTQTTAPTQTTTTPTNPTTTETQQQPSTEDGFSLCDLLTGITNTELAYDTLILGLTPDCQQVKNVESCIQSKPQDIEDLGKSVETTANLLKNVNEVRSQLGRLNFDTLEKDFFDNEVDPFLSTLTDIASASANLASAANILNQTMSESRKDIKDTFELVADLNEKAEDVYKVLRKRINTLLKLGRMENKAGFFRKL